MILTQNSMEESGGIDRFCVSFLKSLSCGILQDIYTQGKVLCGSSIPGEVCHYSIRSKFTSLNGLKKYVQIILLVGLIVQLQAGMNFDLSFSLYLFVF